MAEYLEREALLHEMKMDIRPPFAVVRDFPPADVAPVVHGKWIEYPRPHYFKCNKCKYTVPYRKALLHNGKRDYNYCPHCGAKMDLEDENESA